MKGFITIVNMGDGKYKPIVEGELSVTEVLDMLQVTEKFFIGQLIHLVQTGKPKEGEGEPCNEPKRS